MVKTVEVEWIQSNVEKVVIKEQLRESRRYKVREGEIG